MIPAELQKILQSNEKLSVKQVKEIIWQLQQDCFQKKYELIQDDLTPKEYIAEQRFYDGETNAFYICLDLMEKVGE